jgi:hypothetical protein
MKLVTFIAIFFRDFFIRESTAMMLALQKLFSVPYLNTNHKSKKIKLFLYTPWRHMGGEAV